MSTPSLYQDRQDILQTAWRFADAAARFDVPAMRDVWQPDGEWHLPPVSEVHRGADAILAKFTELRGALSFFVQHALGGPIDVTGDTAQARLYYTECGIVTGGAGDFQVSGVNEDSYVRTTQGWKLRIRRADALWFSFGTLGGATEGYAEALRGA